MRLTRHYVFFWAAKDYLSNLFACENEIDYDGFFFKTSEQFFMYLKALQFTDIDMADKIAETQDLKLVKELGRKVKGFDPKEWEEVKEDVMFKALQHKFDANPRLIKKLLDTENLILVEASPYDTIWGVGLKETDPKILDPSNWVGKNLLGVQLMRLRDFYRNGQ